MLEFIWVAMLVCGIVYSLLCGNGGAFVDAVSVAASSAVQLTISLCGIFAVWCGIMETARSAGVLNGLVRMVHPVIKKLFGGISAQAEQAVALNITANILGMGSAATPAGQQAAGLLAGEGKRRQISTLLIINNSALTLLPTTVIAMRTAAGSASPADILPAALLASAVSTAVALLLDYALPHKST